MNKTIYITESQARLLSEATIDYDRINTVREKLDSYGFQKVTLSLPNGTSKTAVIPTNAAGEFLKNKKGVVAKTFDDLFYLLQRDFRDTLTSDHAYRDAIIRHVIANWAFPDRYELWFGTGATQYTDNAGKPMFSMV